MGTNSSVIQSPTPEREGESGGDSGVDPKEASSQSESRAEAEALDPERDGFAPGGDGLMTKRAVLAHQLCAVMRRLHQRGWCEGSGGNFSCVLQRDPILLLMAPSGVDKGSVAPEQLLVVNDQARVVQGQGNASAETLLHLEIVRNTEAGAVLHTHSQSATLLSALEAPANSNNRVRKGEGVDGELGCDRDVGYVEHQGLEMLKGLRGILTHQTRVRVPVLNNDQKLRRLSDRSAPHLREAPHGLLIAGHGLYAWGSDLSEAMRHTEIHEFLLEQNWRLRLLNALQQSVPEGDPRR